MLEELKALLVKYNACISIETEGEGYSQTSELVIEINSSYSDFKSEVIGIYGNEITQFNL